MQGEVVISGNITYRVGGPANPIMWLGLFLPPLPSPSNTLLPTPSCTPLKLSFPRFLPPSAFPPCHDPPTPYLLPPFLPSPSFPQPPTPHPIMGSLLFSPLPHLPSHTRSSSVLILTQCIPHFLITNISLPSTTARVLTIINRFLAPKLNNL